MTVQALRPSLRRTLRSLVRPAGLVIIALLAFAPLRDLAVGAVLLGWSVAFACAALWLAQRLHQVFSAPRHEGELADRLDLMLNRAGVPGWQLVEILGDSWASTAGQEAVTIDVRTGQSTSVWFAQAHFPLGAMVLVDDRRRPVDWLLPEQVAAAYRHVARRCAKATAPRAARQRRRDERRSAKLVLIEAEDLLRSGG